MVQTTTCLCEASCGILVDTEGEHIRSIRGDENDPFSLGYVCHKATALADLHNDPDRLRAPLVRERSRGRCERRALSLSGYCDEMNAQLSK
jgi:anaerobic selenocysteine-containing dehydrogenase